MVALDDQGLTQLEAFKKSMPISDGKGHYWDEALNGWRNDDGSVYDPNWQNKQVQNDQYFGNFDAGAAENLGSYQSQQPQQTFSLGGSGFKSFNVANPDMDNNGLDDSTGWAVGVVRDIGSPSGYSYNGTPVTTNGAAWQGPVQQQGSILGESFPQSPAPFTGTPTPNTASSNPWTYNAALASANPLAEPDPLASSFRETVRQPEPLGQGYTPDPRFPETPMLGNPAMGALGLYDRVTNPVVETASQLLPSVITAGKYAPGISGAVALGLTAADKLGFGYNPEENALKGLGQLGDSAKQAVQNPTNPLAFGEAQNEKFAERPLWQQIGGQVAFDPGNYIGLGALKKLGLADETIDFIKGTDKAVDAAKAGRVAPEVTRAIPDIPHVSPDDIAFGVQDTAASTGMRVLDKPTGNPRVALQELSNQAAKVEETAARLAREGDQAGADRAFGVLDILGERMRALQDTLAGEAGSVPISFAGRLGVNTALGAGVGAAYGQASGGDWKTGAAIGALGGAGATVAFKAADNLASKGVAAKLAQNAPPEGPTAKLIDMVKQAKPVRAEQQALYSEELAKRAGRLGGIQGRKAGESGVYQGLGALKGELPKATFDPVRQAFAQSEIDDLINHVNDLGLQPFTKSNTQVALIKVLGGQLPTNSEIRLLGDAFGDDFAKALLSKRSLGAKAWENMVDAANIPRTLMTAWDASAPLRQGAVLLTGHPIEGAKAFGAMVKSMASPKYAELVDDLIQNSPNKGIYDKMGLYFAPAANGAADLSRREEAIMSKLAGNIPGVGGSQRGYVTFLNKLRQGIADNFIAGNPNLSAQEYKDFGHFINIASGRGDLPKVLSENSAILNAAFAPRYAMSRIQLPGQFAKMLDPRLGGAVRKEIARDMFAFLGTGVSVLTLGKLAGIWTVELDPRSTDFGKGKAGNTRFDFWAGEQQMARYAAQILTGERKTSTGKIVDATRKDTVMRWLQSKQSPAVGLATDLYRGENFIGEPIEGTKESIGKMAFERLVPLFLQDMADAAKDANNQFAAAKAIPAAFGAGTQTYKDSPWKQRDAAIANNPELQRYYIDPEKPGSWENLSNAGREAYENSPDAVTPPVLSEEGQRAAEVTTQLTTEQTASDTRRQEGELTPEQWRKDYTDRKNERFIRNDEIYHATNFKPGKDTILNDYYAAIAAAERSDGTVDWDKVDAYRASLDGPANQHIETNTGLVKIDTPVVREFEQAKAGIEESGYFSKRRENWTEVSRYVPTWDALGSPVDPKDYESYDDWRQAALKAALALDGKTFEDIATVTKIESWLEKQEPAKGMEYFGKQWTDEWAANNPQEAYEAWRYGYFSPRKEIKDWLASQFE